MLSLKNIKTLHFKSTKPQKNSQHLTKNIKNFKFNKLNKNNYLVKIKNHNHYYNTNPLYKGYRYFHNSSKLNKPNFFNKIFFKDNILTKMINLIKNIFNPKNNKFLLNGVFTSLISLFFPKKQLKKNSNKKFQEWKERENKAGGLDNSELLEELENIRRAEAEEEKIKRQDKALIEQENRLETEERLRWENFMIKLSEKKLKREKDDKNSNHNNLNNNLNSENNTSNHSDYDNDGGDFGE